MCSLPNHFLHPSHPLVPKDYAAGTVYLCKGCNLPGLHKGYCCNSCNFNMHEFCATCPTTLNSFMHPHPLSLLTRTREDTSRTLRFCKVCRDQVHGLIYRCDYCDFDVHPICTRLPQYVRHVGDPHQSLSLRYSSHGLCAVCRESCTSWRYSCGPCGFHIHIQCAADSTPPTSTQGAVRTQPLSLSLSAPPPPLSLPSTYSGYGTHHGVSYGLQPPYGGYHHANYTTSYNTHSYAYPPGQGGAAGSSGGIGNMMAAIVINLLSNVIYDLAGVGFSSI